MQVGNLSAPGRTGGIKEVLMETNKPSKYLCVENKGDDVSFSFLVDEEKLFQWMLEDEVNRKFYPVFRHRTPWHPKKHMNETNAELFERETRLNIKTEAKKMVVCWNKGNILSILGPQRDVNRLADILLRLEDDNFYKTLTPGEKHVLKGFLSGLKKEEK